MPNSKGELYEDQAKTIGLFPYTKVSCISDDSGTSLSSTLSNLETNKQNVVLYGTSEPASSLGNNGDIYLMYIEE